MPVSRPSTVMTIGKMKGVMVSRMPIIIAPLIMLPNKRTARASVLHVAQTVGQGVVRRVRETAAIVLDDNFQGLLIHDGAQPDFRGVGVLENVVQRFFDRS